MRHTSGMRVADLVLRYIEAVEWPVVVVLVVVLFRRSIRTVLGRLSELSGAGVSAKFQTEAERLAGRAAALSAERDPLAATGYPRVDTNPRSTPLAPSPLETSPYAPGWSAPYLPQSPYGDGDGVPPSPYAFLPGPDGPAAPAQAASAEERETAVPPPPSRPGDDWLDHIAPHTPPAGQPDTRGPAAGDEPSDGDEEPAPATEESEVARSPHAASPTERTRGESTDGGPTGGYDDLGAYRRGEYHGGPGEHGSWAGEGVSRQPGPPPPPYAAAGPRGPVAAGGAYVPARARADADPAAAVRLAWTQLRAVIAGLARGHETGSGVYAQVGAMGAGADVTGLIRELDDMRREAADGTAPVTADAARAYVTAAEHVTTALTTTTNR